MERTTTQRGRRRELVRVGEDDGGAQDVGASDITKRTTTGAGSGWREDDGAKRTTMGAGKAAQDIGENTMGKRD